jgi:hypothetical protein
LNRNIIKNQYEWKYRSYESIFETRDRRDQYNKKIHQRVIFGSSDVLQVEREEDAGKFVCEYGKEYDEGRNLRRYRQRCNIRIILVDPEEDAGAFPPNRINNT